MTGAAPLGAVLRELLEPAVVLLHRRGWREAITADFLRHVRALHDDDGGSPDASIGALFVDLAHFTPMTDAMGDRSAASVVGRLADQVHAVARSSGGSVAKHVGDGFLLVFDHPPDAVRAGVELAEWVGSQDAFPSIHLGASVGDCALQDGEFVGATVNLASRLSAAAEPGEFLLTEPLAVMVRDTVTVRPLGGRALRGMVDPVSVWSVAVVSDERWRRDPVCHMRVAEDGPHWLSGQRGREVFCSVNCREAYREHPERYASAR